MKSWGAPRRTPSWPSSGSGQRSLECNRTALKKASSTGRTRHCRSCRPCCTPATAVKEISAKHAGPSPLPPSPKATRSACSHNEPKRPPDKPSADTALPCIAAPLHTALHLEASTRADSSHPRRCFILVPRRESRVRARYYEYQVWLLKNTYLQPSWCFYLKSVNSDNLLPFD